MAEASRANPSPGTGIGCEDVIGGRRRTGWSADVTTAIVPVGLAFAR